MQMKNVKHFIWDFDGTLLDTYPAITGYLKMALADFGYDVSQTDIMEQMLVNIPHAIKYYANKFGIENLNEHYKKYRKDEFSDKAEAFPYIKEVLWRIKENGGANYVFTHRGDSTYSMLEEAGILDAFDEIVTSKSPQFKLKPAPDVINYLMEKYGGTVENTAMVGDRECDLGSGYNAGCKTIHLITPAVPQYPKCDWRIKDFGEMLDMLK